MATTTCTEFVSIKTFEPELMSHDDILDTVLPMEVEEGYNVNEKIKTVMSGWTDKYKNRFSKWYLKRSLKYCPKLISFDEAMYLDPFDCYKHLINWDRSFKKALMKDKLIDKQRLKIRQEVHKIHVIDPITHNDFYVPRHIIGRYLKHPVENNASYCRLERMDIDEVNCDIHMIEQGILSCSVVDFGELMIEQGKYIMVGPNKEGVVITHEFDIDEDCDDEPFLSYPFGDPEINLIVQPYLDTSPFFTGLFQSCKNLCTSLNKYMERVRFKKGTPSYYRDWLFGTRRSRDDLKKIFR